MFLQDTFRKVHVSSFGSITSIEHTIRQEYFSHMLHIDCTHHKAGILQSYVAYIKISDMTESSLQSNVNMKLQFIQPF
jgi:hypothetical protein